MITAIAGGVGAARFLRGLSLVNDPASVTAVVNVGDDFTLHGLSISPDIDTITYTLAGLNNTQTGWGLAGETWACRDQLIKLGGQTWFSLGDTDIATHLYRTQRLFEGASLTEVTSEISAALGVTQTLLPATEDSLATMVTLGATNQEVEFQRYFVEMRHEVEVRSLRYSGANQARANIKAIEAIARAEKIIICPSNPVLSIAPILAIEEIASDLKTARSKVITVSPIIGGKAVKGPTTQIMKDLGLRPDALGVAEFYADYTSQMVIDNQDAHLAKRIEDLGIEVVITDTLMVNDATSASLAKTCLA